jgi:hypothetical protein
MELLMAKPLLSTVRSTINIDRQTAKEFVYFVLSACGEGTIAHKQNHENSQMRSKP